MKINLKDLEDTLKKLPGEEAQPRMVLGCFLGLRRGNTEHCEECKHYGKTCEVYLRAFEISETKGRE